MDFPDTFYLALRDLPGTAVLALFVWLQNKQATAALEIAKNLMSEVHSLMAECMKMRQWDRP